MILNFVIAWITSTVILAGSVWITQFILNEVVPMITTAAGVHFLTALGLWLMTVTLIAAIWTYIEEKRQ